MSIPPVAKDRAPKPDDQDKHQAAAAQARQQAGEVARAEGPDPEQVEVEHRVRHARLDDAEDGQHDGTADEGTEHPRVGPPHDVAGVRLDPVRDGDQDRDETDPEGEVAPPVDAAVVAHPVVVELEVGPYGAEEADRYGHQEHQVPVDWREDPPDDQAQEGPGDGRDHVEPQGQAALVDRERIGDDRVRVAHQQGAPDALKDPHDDQPQDPGGAGQPGRGQQDREDREDGEPGVVPVSYTHM